MDISVNIIVNQIECFTQKVGDGDKYGVQFPCYLHGMCIKVCFHLAFLFKLIEGPTRVTKCSQGL